MRSETSLHARGPLKATVRHFEGGFLTLKIESADGEGAEVQFFVDSLAELDVIADAIFYAKMDRDEEKVQADGAATMAR